MEQAERKGPEWRIGYEKTDAELADGIEGRALHLGSAAAMRRAVQVNNPLRSVEKDFTFSLWVKGDAALKGWGMRSYDILSAACRSQAAETGWRLGMQAGGAWCFTVSGDEKYIYEPTSMRQTIRDGRWHHLAFTFHAEEPEIRFYYDGVNVAIYSVPGLVKAEAGEGSQDEGNAAGASPAHSAWWMADSLWIGGERIDDSEQAVFPGWIDELWIDGRALTAEEIGSRFAAHREPRQELMAQAAGNAATLNVMTFNIWNGGRETGAEIGVQRVIDVIRDSGADIVAMQETYGSGPIIADALGYYFYLRSSNLSILSRFPIEETYPLYRPFHCGGARIKLGNGRHINVFSIWLHYLADYWSELHRRTDLTAAQLLEGERERMEELAEIMKALQPLAARSGEEPLLLCGDFNSGSHLDWTEATKKLHNGYVFPFPQSKALQEAGYRDTYREIHPDPAADPCVTWPAWEQEYCVGDRIDFIYAHGPKATAEQARRIHDHHVRYPSDHAAVVVGLRIG